MKKTTLFITILSLSLFMPFSAGAKGLKGDTLIAEATTAFEGMVQDPEEGIPRELIEKCEGIAIFAGVKKVGFGIGVRRGHGIVMAKDEDGKWSPPAFFTLTGASTGWQAGLQAMDIVLLFMEKDAFDKFLSKQFTIGADAVVAAGPNNSRALDANTNTKSLASILSYTKIKKGLFAGVAIKGARISFNKKETKKLYNEPVTAREIVLESKAGMPEQAKTLVDLLARYSVPSETKKTAKK